jgi:hypothetical protein
MEHVEAAPISDLPSASVSAPAPSVFSFKALLSGFLGFLVLGTVVNAKATIDANLAKTTALPAAAAANYSATIDLNSLTAGRVPRVELAVTMPATPSLVDAKTIILTVKDSADNITFAAVADLPTITALGAGGVGAAAVARRFKLPIGIQRYVRLDAAVLAAGGDNTAISTTLALVF